MRGPFRCFFLSVVRELVVHSDMLLSFVGERDGDVVREFTREDGNNGCCFGEVAPVHAVKRATGIVTG